MGEGDGVAGGMDAVKDIEGTGEKAAEMDGWAVSRCGDVQESKSVRSKGKGADGGEVEDTQY